MSNHLRMAQRSSSHLNSDQLVQILYTLQPDTWGQIVSTKDMVVLALYDNEALFRLLWNLQCECRERGWQFIKVVIYSLIAVNLSIKTFRCIKDWVQLFCAQCLKYPQGGCCTINRDLVVYLCKTQKYIPQNQEYNNPSITTTPYIEQPITTLLPIVHFLNKTTPQIQWPHEYLYLVLTQLL